MVLHITGDSRGMHILQVAMFPRSVTITIVRVVKQTGENLELGAEPSIKLSTD